MNKRILSITIIYSGIFFLLWIIIFSSPLKPKPFGDLDFHIESKTLSGIIKGEIPKEEFSITRAPLPSFIYTVPYLFVKSSSIDKYFWYSGLIFNFFLLLLSNIYFLKSIRKIGKNADVWAAVILLIFPLHIYYSFALAAELPAIAISFFLAGYYIKYLENIHERNKFIVVSSLLLLISFCRPNSILVFPFLIAFIALHFFLLKNLNFKQFINLTIICLITIFVGFFALEILKNQSKEITSGRGQDEHLWYVIHEGNFQFRNEPFNWAYWQKNFRANSVDYNDWVKSKDSLNNLASTTDKDINYYYKELMVNEYRTIPLIKIRQFFIKVVYGQFFNINRLSPENFKLLFFKGPQGYFFILILINLINIIIFILSILYLLKNLLKSYLIIPFSIILSLHVFHGLVYMEPRYLLVLRPFFVLISVLYICENKIFNKIWRLAKRK
jgi:hypothetical protein